jgi:tetratricopeptide (TPR) repeat protein
VNKNLRLGRTWDASQHIYWHGLLKIYQGCFHEAQWMVTRLRNIAQEYDNEFSMMLMYELNINMLLESRNLKEALLESEKAIILAQETIFHIYLFDLYSYKTWIHILLQDMAEAEICLQEMRKIKRTTTAVPIELISFYRTEMEFWLCKLEESIQKGEARISPDFRKAFKTSQRKMVRVSKKAAQHRTELCKLTGKYYWLIGKQNYALIWWRKAIEEGTQRGARLELSRAYFEIGKRLLEPGSKHKMLNGVVADDYLEKAKELFEEMDLRWDLDELGRVAALGSLSL